MSGESAFDLSIITHDRIVFEGRATSVVAPGAYGYLGVMARHRPMIASLGRGTLTVVDEAGDTDRWALNQGIMEVVANTVTILAEDIRSVSG